MPRTPWGRRRTTDSPRPAGRRWAGRLRRSGSLARRVLFIRAGLRRRIGASQVIVPGGPDILDSRGNSLDVLDGRGNPLDVLDGSGGRLLHAAELVAPLSPAVPARHPGPIPLLPGAQTPGRRLRFALVQACTLASLTLGMLAIFLSLSGKTWWAAALLVGCVIFDGADGLLARRFGVASPFGAQMDSLADMCSFGIATPVVVYTSIHGSAPGAMVAGACALVACCAAIRLARFNVSPKDGRFFCGVPTTMAAAVLGIAMLIGLRLPGLVSVIAIAVLALAMVSSFPYAKLARIAALPAWLWVVPLAGALLDYRVTFVVLVGLYLLSGPVLWLRARRQPVASGH